MKSITEAQAWDADAERIVRMDELLRRLQISRATVYRWLDQKRFPRPVRLGERTIGWRSSDLSGWLAEREAA